MGNIFKSGDSNSNPYSNIEEVLKDCEEAGLESSNLILGIDFTKSNETKGKKSFGGKPLHKLDLEILNPYEKCIQIIGRTLARFDEDEMIPCFGFGDITTKGHSVFPFLPDLKSPRFCKGFSEVLAVYKKITPNIKLSGPTNFEALILKAIKIVSSTKLMEYHILVIICDGCITNEYETREAIKKASNYPISIIVVGVGDGPFDKMNEFDDSLIGRKFDNFNFVNYDEVYKEALKKKKDFDKHFAHMSLYEIPAQYRKINKLGLIRKGKTQNTDTVESYDKKLVRKSLGSTVYGGVSKSYPVMGQGSQQGNVPYYNPNQSSTNPNASYSNGIFQV